MGAIGRWPTSLEVVMRIKCLEQFLAYCKHSTKVIYIYNLYIYI